MVWVLHRKEKKTSHTSCSTPVFCNSRESEFLEENLDLRSNETHAQRNSSNLYEPMSEEGVNSQHEFKKINVDPLKANSFYIGSYFLRLALNKIVIGGNKKLDWLLQYMFLFLLQRKLPFSSAWQHKYEKRNRRCSLYSVGRYSRHVNELERRFSPFYNIVF